jgi:hypothetical protein
LFDAHWVLIALVVPESGKVCIYIAVKLKMATWLEGEAIILDSLQIPTHVIHSFLVAFLWTVGAEASTLVDGKLNLRMHIGREIHKHSNY